MICCVFRATNLVNKSGIENPLRIFVSMLKLAINYIRCWQLAYCYLTLADCLKELSTTTISGKTSPFDFL